MSEIAIRAVDLGKRYRIGAKQASYRTLRESLADVATAPIRRLAGAVRGRVPGQSDNTIWALRDVSFEVKRGEVIGIIGRNGAGKTTLLKILSRITKPTEGSIDIWGRVGSLLEVGTGFHPELTGRENVYLNGAILGMKRSEIRRKFDEIIEFAGVEKFLDTPVKHYSSGMYVRLAFAVAAHLEPEMLLVDEVLAVGDAAFQKKCLGRMANVARTGRTVLFVSHNMAAVQNLCTTAFLLDRGRVIASGTVGDVIGHYLQTVADSRDNDLVSRTDRQGSGKFRFVRFYVGSYGQPRDTLMCGDSVSLVLGYEGQSPLRNVHVSVGLYSSFGQGAAYLSNDIVGRSFDVLKETGSLVCNFDKLPLMPGTYSVNLYCTVNGVLADWVIDAATIDVVEGDYFGTGKLPLSGYGAVVVAHEWDAVFE